MNVDIEAKGTRRR